MYTARFGQHFVGGGVYQMWKTILFECGWMGVPVKDYQWLSEFNAYGQWFEGGAIYYRNGSWNAFQGNLGQTAGRLTGSTYEKKVKREFAKGLNAPTKPALDPEMPPDPPVEVDTPPAPEPSA